VPLPEARDGAATMGYVSSEQAEPDRTPTSLEPPEGADAEQPEKAESGPMDDPGSGRRPAPSRRLLALLFGVAALVLALDIITKSLVVANLDGRPPLKLLGGLVYLDLLRNSGAAFSLATGLTWLLALLAIAVVAAIVWIAPKLRSAGWAVGLGLVLGGASGNLVDRIFRAPGPLQGKVVDFISVFAPNGGAFAVFNIADSSIVCGGILVVLLSVLGREYDGTVRRGRSEAGGES
jgi:signal peptidase II